MPANLHPVPFAANMVAQAKVQAFSCGNEDYEREVSEWIKGRPPGDSVVESMAGRQTRVWLYFNDAKDLVGYGSIGPARWKDERSGDWFNLSCIPMLGVDSRFMRQGFGRQILRNLFVHAVADKAVRPVLGLWVHPKNAGAKALYLSENFGFTASRGGMDRMILAL